MRSFERLLSLTTVIAASTLGQALSAAETATYPGTDIHRVSQGWSAAEQEAFWFGNQGSQLLSYDIFVNLEQADSDELFRAPANIERFGYIPWPASPRNPDALPIGFVKDEDPGTGKAWMGFTCAACHTNLVNYGGRTLLIDGAPTLADMPAFLDALVAAMRANQERPKLARLTKRVYGGTADANKRGLMLRRLREETAALAQRQDRNRSELAYGNGRLDAFGQIFNEVSTHHLGVTTNARPPNAPVSYPFLWGTPQSDIVQWNGVAENAPPFGALQRNVGEVLGVFGDLRIIPGDPPGGYPSSVRVVELAKLENLIERLWRPSWQEAGLPEPDATAVAAGGEVYREHCQKCHLILDDPTAQHRQVATRTVPLAKIGTDPRMARNAVDLDGATGSQTPRLTGRLESSGPVPGTGDPRLGAEAPSLTLVGKAVFGALRHAGPDTYAAVVLDQCDLTTVELGAAGTPPAAPAAAPSAPEIEAALDDVRHCYDRPVAERLAIVRRALQPAVTRTVTDLTVLVGRPPAPATVACEDQTARGLLCYRARPLDGIWATAPYLHNGSVPTLADLLKPPVQRPATFRVGSSELGHRQGGLQLGPDRRRRHRLRHHHRRQSQLRPRLRHWPVERGEAGTA